MQVPWQVIGGPNSVSNSVQLYASFGIHFHHWCPRPSPHHPPPQSLEVDSRSAHWIHWHTWPGCGMPPSAPGENVEDTCQPSAIPTIDTSVVLTDQPDRVVLISHKTPCLRKSIELQSDYRPTLSASTHVHANSKHERAQLVAIL